MTIPLPVESLEVPASAESGNVPIEEIAPIAPSPVPEPPVAPAEPAAPATPAEPNLYELPDGRKVDGATLAKEFKENFLPDYTKKAQELAHLKAGTVPKATEITTPKNPLADPNYAPKDYLEFAEVVKKSTLQELEAREQAKIQERNNIETAVNDQLTAVKALDKNVNENQLFLHATKYHFKDLRVAYQNMKDMEKMVKDVQQATAKNVLKRNDPVSVIPGQSGGNRPDPSQFANAREYLRSLQP